MESNRSSTERRRSSVLSEGDDPSLDNANVSESGSLSIIILGASGDLAKKKTFPALFNLYQQGFLQSNEVHIFGYARTKISDDELRDRIRGHLLQRKGSSSSSGESEDAAKFLQLVKYISGAYDGEEGFRLLDTAIYEREVSKNTQDGSSRRLFYLALPPSVYPSPFGKDLKSAEALSGQIGELFGEEQIYRIDHYLGKELVQNLIIYISSNPYLTFHMTYLNWMLLLRFANRFFYPLWNRDNIDNIQIVFREDFGTEGQGGYFDEYGIIQNHLIQVLCLVAMEKPVSLTPEHIRDEKVKVLQSVVPIKDEEVVLGQYEGYKDDATVPNDSNAPTFATVVLRIHNERWEGVPFVLKAGKALNSRKAEIRVQFKEVPGDIFKCVKQGRNEFVIRLQPSEAMYMKFTVKQPGLEMSTIQSELDLSYQQLYQGVKIPEAYERSLGDIHPNAMYHQEAWEIFTLMLHRIDDGKLKPVLYKQGSRGPVEADELLAKAGYMQTHGYKWVQPNL
ncbi:hypothetical protein MKX01_022048 [Papaver californicum]|nr:hypothetical protein MKX01_022048 [Papaver californicum]